MNRNFESSAPSARRALALAVSGLALAGVALAQNDNVGLSTIHSALFVERSQEGFFPAPNDLFGLAVVAADFSGDGVDELVTGIPGDDCSATILDCGAVFLSWGNPGVGLIDQGGFLWAGAAGSPATATPDDLYGRALAAGDFNGDGLADLVIGAPGGRWFAIPGNAQIHYGLPGAIQVVPEQILEPGVSGVPDDGLDDLFRNARFGAAFATGDFNGDGHDDLAVAAPDWTFDDGLVSDAGVVIVAQGHIGGLLPFDGYLISQNEPAIPDDAEGDDRFGSAIAAGDFNGDGFDDLAIGVPNEDEVGAVLLLFGSPNSLLFANHYWLGEVDLGAQPQPGARFGGALVAGDWNGDHFDDLAIGTPLRDDGAGNVDVGMIGVLFGAPGSPLSEPAGGFNFSATQWWWEDLLGYTSAAHEKFGEAMTSADFDGDGYDDLAVATPGNAAGAGAVTVLGGSPWPPFGRRQRLYAGQGGVPGPLVPQPELRFGQALVAGDFDGNGHADLAVAMPRLDVGDAVDAGGEVVLYGSLFSDGFENGSFGVWSASFP